MAINKNENVDYWRVYRSLAIDYIKNKLNLDPVKDDRVFYLCDQLAYRLANLVQVSGVNPEDEEIVEIVDSILRIPLETIKLVTSRERVNAEEPYEISIPKQSPLF